MVGGEVVLSLAWLIPVFPVLAWLIIGLSGRKMQNRGSGIAIPAVLISFLFSLAVLVQVAQGQSYHTSFTWLEWPGFQITFGFQVDPLAAMMLVVVTLVSLLVQIYSLGYMQGDSHYSRYYANLSLFTAAMLTLLLADNYLLLLIAWELVGLCSYLLIGHYFRNPGVPQAANKAFLTTRVGDFGFMIALMAIFNATGTFNFQEIFALAQTGAISQGTLVLVTAGLFLGAAGKSAQFPFQVWLPDAMAGPTPVSALIHAATMVAAGVYLIARSLPLYLVVPQVMQVVAWVGGVTALLAAAVGLVVNDIKKVLAYSTISQLGYMMLGLGVGAFFPGVFHLMTHAFFKALLFLGAGSVIHAVHTQDMREMGGLGRRMPYTTLAFLAGSLALAGVFPFAGFYSKDSILAAVYASGNSVLFWMGVVAAILTAFYITRAVVLTFWHQPRSQGAEQAQESSPVMTVPLLILSGFALAAGWLGADFSGNILGGFLGTEFHLPRAIHHYVTRIATVAALGGIVLAIFTYLFRWFQPSVLTQRFPQCYQLLQQAYYFDRFYNRVFVTGTIRVAEFVAWFDQTVIDGLVNAVGRLGKNLALLTAKIDVLLIDGFVVGFGHSVGRAGDRVRRWQNGLTANYLLSLVWAVLISILTFKLLG